MRLTRYAFLFIFNYIHFGFTPLKVSGGLCRDFSSSCKRWSRQGYCKYLSRDCPKSCGRCKPKKNKFSGAACKDKSTSCTKWSLEGYCKFVENECPRACRKCRKNPRRSTNASQRAFKCPDGFNDIKDVRMCLRHEDNLKNWNSAFKFCYDMKSELATAVNKDDMRIIREYLQDPPFTKDYEIREITTFWGHWMGATNRFKDKKWRWVDNTGSLIPLNSGKQYWDFNEPLGVNKCLVAFAGRFTTRDWHGWNSHDCYEKRPFICLIRY